MSAKNKFIRITLTEGKDIKIVWKDSYRIFNVSLEDLCKVFRVKGKVSKYNPKYNTIEVLRDPQLLKEFKDYSIQDSVALYDALAEAQTLYLNNYSTDSAYHDLISFYFST